jgi:hypothetical protein
MGEQTSIVIKWRSAFRMIVVVTWVLIIAVTWFFPRTMPKAIPMAAFWWFRAIAVLGFVYLLYEVGQVSKKRVGVVGVVLDGVLVLPMFVFWFAALAAAF